MILALATMFGVLSTADVCEQPMPGGVGEPEFCEFSEPTRISTPLFTFVAEANVLVGIHRGGARAVVESSIRQSQIGLVIEAHPPEDNARVLAEFGRCGNLVTGENSVLVCDRSSEGIVAATYLIRGRLSTVVAHYTATENAKDFMPVFAQMIFSIDADGPQ